MGHVLDVSDDSQIVMTSMFPMSKNCHIFNEGNDEDVLSLSVMTVMFFTSVITAVLFKSVMGFFFLDVRDLGHFLAVVHVSDI